jgi:hypothetical protein
MPTLHNTEARLLWAPEIVGFGAIQWLPGRNFLHAEYWAKACKNADVLRWQALGWIRVTDEDSPDPAALPTAAELAAFTVDELRASLSDNSVPVQWHKALEGELARREPAKVPPPRETLAGVKVDAALAMIESESNADTLAAWATDPRKAIKEALLSRIAKLAGVP